MTKITALAVENLDLLHHLDGPLPDGLTSAELARELGKDKSNFAKTLGRLRDEGVVGEGIALTDAGRSLTRLITADGEVLADDATLLLRHDQLQPDPDNARTEYDAAAIDDLADDILQRSRPRRVGLLHALTVIPPSALGVKWRMKGGGRRWLAIGRLIERGLLPDDAPVPCTRHEGLSDRDAFTMGLVENLQREDLHPLDEGSAYVRGVRDFDMNVETIAFAVKKSRKHVSDRIAIVEKLDDDAKRRMRLPADHEEHLHYAGARRLMQAQNAKPKPAVDVDPKEALVLLEIADRVAKRPSRHQGAEGWSEIPAEPMDSVVANSLQSKGLIDFATLRFDGGAHRSFVRLADAKATELRIWIGEQGLSPLWSARSGALDSGIAAALEQSGRYATPWLNDPLPEPEPEPAPSPQGQAPAPAAQTPEPNDGPARLEQPLDRDVLTPTQRRILREIAARSIHRHRLLDGWVEAHAAALADPDFQALWDFAFVLRRQVSEDAIEMALTLAGRDHLKARGQAPQDGLSRNSCATPWLRETVESEQQEPRSADPLDPDIPSSLLKLAGVPETPKVEVPELQLSEYELTVLADVASKIAAEPLAGRALPDGKPAFVGCAVDAYHRDAKALRLVTELRLLAFGPSARDVMMCTLTKRALAWIEANPLPKAKPPYATPWLNAPEPEAKAAAAPAAAAADMPRISGFGLPVLAPPTEIMCALCEHTFELSQDCGDLPSTQQAHFFEFEAETVECPSCKAQLRLAGAIVTHVDRQGAPL